MSIISSIQRSVVASLLIAALAGIAVADTIRLKDGSIIKGKIVSFAGGKFTVSMGTGARQRELKFSASEIESIAFDSEATSQNASYKSGTPAEPTPPKSSTAKMKPIRLDVKVLADATANGWTNTGWVVKKGQRIRISGEGKVSLGNGKTSPPSGVANLPDNNKLLKNVATGALVAVIGDDNNDFIYIGATREFTATRDGALFLGVNEGHLEDNSGSFNVKVEIMPDGE